MRVHANVRVHATTRRVVTEHFAEEHPSLQALPAGAFHAVLRMERRITRDGMVSVDGNLYSVPNATRRRPVEVHSTAHEIHIFEQDRLIAVHPVLEGRGQRRIAAGHRSLPPPANWLADRYEDLEAARLAAGVANWVGVAELAHTDGVRTRNGGRVTGHHVRETYLRVDRKRQGSRAPIGRSTSR